MTKRRTFRSALAARAVFAAIAALPARAALLALAVPPLLLAPPGLDAAPPQRLKTAANPAAETAPVPAAPAAPDLSLEALLDRAAEYCRRLESSAFDFVCREEIRETIDPKLDSSPAPPPPDPGTSPFLGPTLTFSRARKVKRSYVYDYQCVRAGRAIREVRTQLEENGRKKVVPDAGLATSIVVFSNCLMGPVGLFAERVRADYDFTVAGEDEIGPARVLVVDAKPRPGAPPARGLYGKAWIDVKTGDILRIEWSESRVGHYDVFEERGRKFGRTPRLVMRSEFSAEKNGIRFPSRMSFEETYLDGRGRAFVRSRTEVVYRDFKFFSVEVEVRD
ncbi:MAG TPA: hypothetical protein PLP83_01735 [Candidatus Aminicenantes bacterium]|nr:hypothetical protein [Candidatus Aminicenantes bacterium]